MLQMQPQSSLCDVLCLQVPGITRNDTLTGRKVNVAVLGECQSHHQVMDCLMRPAAALHEGLVSVTLLAGLILLVWVHRLAGMSAGSHLHCSAHTANTIPWPALYMQTPAGEFCFCCWCSLISDAHCCLQRSSSELPEPITSRLPCKLSRRHCPKSLVGRLRLSVVLQIATAGSNRQPPKMAIDVGPCPLQQVLLTVQPCLRLQAQPAASGSP